MLQLKQTTIRQPISFSGVGLHSGESVNLTLHPAPPQTGIQFLYNGQALKAHLSHVSNTQYATQLEGNGITIRTVEHLLSALMAMRVSNVFCMLDHSELPIMDGSSWPFYFALQTTGIEEQDAPVLVARVNKEVVVHQGESMGMLKPAYDQMYEVTLDYAHPLIVAGGLTGKFSFKKDHYPTSLARARTYGFKKDLDFYKKYNLALGGNLKNSVVFDDQSVLNPEGLYFADEVVRHKILDAIGDLSLIGAPFLGSYQAIRPGHTLNILLLKEAVLQHAFDWVPAHSLVEESIQAKA